MATKFWPLGKNRPVIKLEKMMLPVFGGEEGELCPCFSLQHIEDEIDKEFITYVESTIALVLGELSDREYLTRRAIGGTMPLLNHILEEMKLKYGDCKVPKKVLKSIEDNAAKAAVPRTPWH